MQRAVTLAPNVVICLQPAGRFRAAAEADVLLASCSNPPSCGISGRPMLLMLLC